MRTTTRLGVVTQRLTDALDDVLPPSAHRGILAAIVAFLVALSIAEQIRMPVVRPAPPAPIIIIATPTTRVGAGRVMQRQILAPAAWRGHATSTPVPSEPTTAPLAAEPRYVVLAAPPASPLPTPAPPPPASPLPSPAPTQHIIVTTHNDDGSIFTQWECKPYGDWRDQDPMYTHPECAQQP